MTSTATDDYGWSVHMDDDKRVGQRLPYSLQIRFTGTQQAWLVERAEAESKSTGAVVRDAIDTAIVHSIERRKALARKLRRAVAHEDMELALQIADELESVG